MNFLHLSKKIDILNVGGQNRFFLRIRGSKFVKRSVLHFLTFSLALYLKLCIEGFFNISRFLSKMAKHDVTKPPFSKKKMVEVKLMLDRMPEVSRR